MKKEMLILCLLNIGSLFSIIKPSKYLDTTHQLDIPRVDVLSSRIDNSWISQEKKQKYHDKIAAFHKENRTGEVTPFSNIPADGLVQRLEKVEKDFKKASSLGSKIKSTVVTKLGGAKTTLQRGLILVNQTIKNGVAIVKNKGQVVINNAGYGKQLEYKGPQGNYFNTPYSGSEKYKELTLKINSLTDDAAKKSLQSLHDRYIGLDSLKPSNIRELKKLEQQVDEASPYVYVKDEKLEVQNKKVAADKKREQEVLNKHEALRRMVNDEGEQQLPAPAPVAESFAAIKVPENNTIAPGLNMQKIERLKKQANSRLLPKDKKQEFNKRINQTVSNGNLNVQQHDFSSIEREVKDAKNPSLHIKKFTKKIIGQIEKKIGQKIEA